jgi:hypothetical protein
MTFRVHFYAEQAFLAQIKAMLETEPKSENEPNVAALCILACASAIEAFSNHLLAKIVKFRHFDELKITSKIEQLLICGGIEPNWGIEPWQAINRLIKSRNWLAHYKDYEIGLVNSDYVWLSDSYNKLPKIDPYQELTLNQVRIYYNQTRKALEILARSVGAKETDFEFLRTEKYESFLVG